MEFSFRKVNNFKLYANHAWYVPGVGGMLMLLLWFLLGIFLSSLFTVVLGAIVPKQALINYGMLVGYPLMFLPAMVYVSVKSQRNSLFEVGYQLNNKHFGPFTTGSIILLTVALTAGTVISADLPNYLHYHLTQRIPSWAKAYEDLMDIMGQLTGGPFWSSFLLTAIFAPIFEEWLCRGMVLRGLLASRMKPGWAIVLSAAFFAFIHMNPWQALNAFLIGLVMGYVYYRTGCLWLTMLIHFLNNGFAVVCAQIDALAEYDFWIDMMGVSTYTVVYVLSVAVLCLCLWQLHRIPLEQERGNIDEIPVLQDF